MGLLHWSHGLQMSDHWQRLSRTYLTGKNWWLRWLFKRFHTLRVCVATALTTPCQWSLWYPKWTLLWLIYYRVPNWLCVQLRGISMNVEERNIYCLPLRVIYVMTGHHSWTYKNNIESKYNTFSWCIDEQEMNNKYPFHLESYRQREINLSPLKD